MEIGDFSFFGFAPFLLIPSASVYLVLKRLGWEYPASHFMDSWFIWLASLAFSLVSYVSLIAVTENAGFYWYIPLLWWVAIIVATLFAANFSASSLIVWQLRKRRGEATYVLAEALPHQNNVSSISKISLLISMAETGTFFLLLALVLIAKTIYEHYYPPQFGIYDI